MGMFGPKPGSWWIRCKSEPYWNASGTSYVGGFVMCPEAEEALEKLKELYGEPPADVEWGYMKD